MDFGLFIRTQYNAGDDMAARFDESAEQARLAEKLGFASILKGSHYAGHPVQELQQLPFLSRIMAEAPSLRLVTGIVLLPLHKPLDIAEQLATIDVMSKGKLTFGCGIGYRDVEFEGFGASPRDRVARFEVGPQRATVYAVLSRPLVFRWMVLSFGGGQVDSSNDPIPDRPYTHIEERFIRRAVGEIAHTLGKVMGTPDDGTSPEITLESPASLFADAKRPHLIASFDITGLAEMSILRIALPSAILERRGGERAPVSVPHAQEMAAEVMDMAVEIGVQIGFADLSLRSISALRPGDEIPLERLSKDGLLVRVEDKAKYRAQAGKMGSRLAVRITEVL